MRITVALLVSLWLAPLAAPPAGAAEWLVTASDPPAALAEALAAAEGGDTVRVRGGVYPGPLTVDRELRLIGEQWPVIDGGGRGTVVSIEAPGVLFTGFEVRASGDSLDQENSGIAVTAPGVEVAGNRLRDVLFGVYLRNAADGVVRGNEIVGKPLDLARRGDAIRVWYSDRAVIEANRVTAGRDVVLWYSSGLAVRGNQVRDGRYGLHFMYCDDAAIEGNLLYGNSVGAFLMYSRRLRLLGNSIAGNHGPSGYGVGLKDMDDALVQGNLFAGNRVGAFLDNSPREIDSRTDVEGNLFAGNDAGVVLMPNVRRALFADNSFAENAQQVSVAGAGGDPEANGWRGNYWSDYAGYDADRDGLGEVPYRAERLFESLADRRPQLRMFLQGPAAEAVDFAARAFPVVRPRPRLTDPAPRMRPPTLAAVPPLPRPGSRSWLPLGAALLLGALGLGAAPALASTGRGGAPPGPDSTGGEPAPGPRPLAAPGAPSLIEARGLGKSFGRRQALAGIDFQIAAGEAVALWGSNGAGKTTALRAILGVIPFTGSLRVAGLDPRRDGREVRRRIGFVPQEIGLRSDWGVAETLDFFVRLRRVSAERIEELLAWLGLEAHAGESVRGLSGGLKQRLALGVALVADPPILLLDEPTANLDTRGRAAFHELLLDLRERGKTLVFTSHRLDEVRLLADRVLHLEEGRLLAAGEAGQLTLSAGAEVEIYVLPEPADLARGAEVLERAGIRARIAGRLLIARVAADRKIAPLAALLEAGVEIRDLGISAETGSGEGNGRLA